MIATLRRGWATATFGSRRPGRRVAGLALCGVVGGVGESLVVVLVVGLVSPGNGGGLPLVGELPETWSVAGAALALVVVLAAAHAASGWISAAAARDVQRTVQRELMQAYVDAPWPVQSSVRAGELQELITVRTQILAYGTQETAQALSAALNVIVLVVAAVALSPFATVGLMLAVGTVIALSLPLRTVRRAAVRESANAQSSLAIELTETASLVREARVFGVDAVASARVGEQIEDAARRQGRVRLAATVTPPLTRDVTVALIVLALAVVVSSGSVDAAVLGAAVVLVLRALSHAQALTAYGLKWTEREEGVRRIRLRLDEWRAPGARGTLPCPSITEVALRDVGFTYPGAEAAALSGVDLRLQRGELVGVVGRTGGGKSTLAGITLGLLVPTRGEVLVDGSPLREIDPRDWHARTAWVGQEPRLLTGTVAENIRFLREWVDDAALERAARDAGLAGELALDHPVGPGGSDVSGGQRQRIAIARALASDPAVVVLDEPTSALDLATEATVRETIERLRHDRIVLVIAHRMSTVRSCDRLVVLEDGRLSSLSAPAQLTHADETWLRDTLSPPATPHSGALDRTGES